MIIREEDNRFIVAGTGVAVNFTTRLATPSRVRIEQIFEGEFEKQQWLAHLSMNCDQSHQH